MKLIDAAKKFLQTKSAKKQAFLDKEHELRSKLTELDAKKSKVIGEYDPSKPFDAKAIDHIEAQIDAVKKELDVLTQTVKLTPDYDVDESIKYIADIKREATSVIAEKKKADEQARAKIAEAKKALLAAQVEHFNVVRQANEFAADTNETLTQLNSGIQRQINILRQKAHEIDLEIYRLSPQTTSAHYDGYAIIDAKRDELSEIRREIQKLEGYAATVTVAMPALSNYRDSNGNTTYFVHSDEQINAANKGILPR